MRKTERIIAILTTLSIATAASAAPQGTTFTYQGKLSDSGAPATGEYDMRFKLFSAPNGGAQLITTLTFDGQGGNPQPIDVVDGLFQVDLDFGQAFGGSAWWLNIEVKPHGAQSYATLQPRQPLNAAPYAAYALAAPGSGTWAFADDDIHNANVGNVGIGLENARSKLHVQAHDLDLFNGPLWEDDIIIEDQDAVLGIYSDGAGTRGSAICLAELNNSELVDKWSIVRNTSTGADSELLFKYGLNANYSSNPTKMVITPTGNVGIGTSSPTAKLHVDGVSGVDGIMFPDGTLQTTASPANGLTLPFNELFAGADETAFGVTQTGTGYAGRFAVDNALSSYSAMFVSSNALWPGLWAVQSNGTTAVRIESVSVPSTQPTMVVTSNGIGTAIRGESRPGADGSGVAGFAQGDGNGVEGESKGAGNAIEGISTHNLGRAGYFEATNPNSSKNAVEIQSNGTNNSRALYALQAGDGDCAEFEINNPESNNHVVDARHAGIGTAVYGQSDKGHGAWFQTLSPNSNQSTLEVQNYGANSAARIMTTNISNEDEALFVSTNGLGGAVRVFDTSSDSNAPAVDIFKGGPGLALQVSGVARVSVLEINGGADLSEGFHVADETAAPGMVVVIDPANPGQLEVSSQAYDRKVAGIIAGAGGVNPGMIMKQTGSIVDGEHPVALTGRVYCMVDASTGAVEPGDLLVTSAMPGHAMKADDYARSQGAIIGKAMTPMPAGETGLVLVLVSLQ